jgi:hypothetical protein
MHLRRLIVLITNVRNIINHQRSCTPAISVVEMVSLQRPKDLCVIRKKTKNHVAKLCLPEGVGSNGTTSDLFTMSKYPARERYRIQLKPNLLSRARCTFGRSGDHRSQPNQKKWWSQTGSNRRHPACKAGALPAELWPQNLSYQPSYGWPGQTRTADLTLIRRAL